MPIDRDFDIALLDERLDALTCGLAVLNENKCYDFNLVYLTMMQEVLQQKKAIAQNADCATAPGSRAN